MASIAAKAVAEEVLGTIGKGEKPNVFRIAVKHGYTPTTANSGQIQKSKTYRDTVSPFIKKLETERNRAINSMKGKIGKAKYRDVTDAIDKLTKAHQLLTGGSTENIAVRPILDVSEDNSNKEDN